MVDLLTRSRGAVRLCLLMSLCAGLACSAHQETRQAGTGDIAFRLVWDGESDLDLFVEDPAGTCIFFGNRDSVTGGLLDVDCNAGSDRLCEQPVENVYWPKGTAPPGSYMYWVEGHSVIPAEAPLAFELQLLRGTDVVWRHPGAFQSTGQIAGPFAIDFAAGARVSPAVVRRKLPECPLRESGKVPETGG